MKPTDGAILRKLSIQLSILMRTDFLALENLSVFELLEVAQEVTEAYGEGRKRNGNRHKNRR